MGRGLVPQLTGGAKARVSSEASSHWAVLVRLLAARVAWFTATLCGAAGLVLLLLWLAPGDPIDLLPNSDELRPVLEEQWQLDRPLWLRYAHFLGAAAQGDLGTSLTYRPGMSVREVIERPALRSLGWLGAALALTMAWATGLAWFTAGRRSPTRHVLRALSVAPVFLLAHLAVKLFNETAFSAMNAGWIDRPSWFALPDQASGLRTALAIVLLAMGSGALADVHREVENALVRVRSSGFVDAARARGGAVLPHVAWNLLLPLTTIASTRAAFFVGGLVILEKVLLLNGVGAILWQAALLRDYPLALGISLVAAAIVCAARLLGDTVRLLVDPRLRTGGSA